MIQTLESSVPHDHRWELQFQVRISLWRRLRKEAEGARNDLKRRDREDDNDSENAPAKRIDIKYDEVDLLTLKSTFRAWTDWKADLERVWAGAPWKYERDTLKIIKAVSKMDKACELAGMPIVETTVYEEYERASQRDNQSPVDFDAYLSSIERELPEVPDSIQANRFYAKLNEDVVKQIKISGLQTLPNTRTEMVALAQRDSNGKLAKGEKHGPVCYSCGQTGHTRHSCPNMKDDTKLKPKARVQQLKLEQRITSPNAAVATSDDESSGNE
ncbi:hypothetical protein V8E54_006365 [Elaphomyces granulatus]